MTPTYRWTVGDVKITRVVELESGGLPANCRLSVLTEDRAKPIEWLHPNYADSGGTLQYSIHTYVVESQGKRIVVDTCIGSDKPRGVEVWNRLSLPFLEHLNEAGFPAESIEIVPCTHLHMDHVGWNTRRDGEKWVPTFPSARYLLGRVEWEHWSSEDHGLGDMPSSTGEVVSLHAAITDSVIPIVEAGLPERVETDHRLTGEVSIRPTPGHSPDT